MVGRDKARERIWDVETNDCTKTMIRKEGDGEIKDDKGEECRRRDISWGVSDN